MNYKDMLDIIDKIEKKEDITLNFLYEYGFINILDLYRECAKWLFKAEFYNYPKEKLSEEEDRIYQCDPCFYESHLNGKHSATYFYNNTYTELIK